MITPNYFLADLPPEATLSPAMLEEACQTLRRNREQYLAGRTTAQMISVLESVAQDWLRPTFHFRNVALEQGPAKSAFSRATIERGLDSFFSQVTAANLRALLEQDLGSMGRLEAFAACGPEPAGKRMAIATAPQLLAHIAGGALPNPTFMSMLLGVLLRSAQFVKCPTGGWFLPLLFAHSLYEADRKLGACIEVATWHGGNHPLEKVLFNHADCLTATGSDEALARIRLRIPQRVRFIGHGHRVSFGFVSNQLQTGAQWEAAISGAAVDVAAWNQLGCLSPHVIYVQTGGLRAAAQFAADLSERLEQIERSEPRGSLPAEGAALIASRRSIYSLRAANSPDTRMWASKDSTAWTVVYEEDPRFQASCLNRFVYVKSASNLTEALHGADAVRGQVSTVGIAAPEQNLPEIAMELARWGVTRVCPLGQMQSPPLAWRHDGRPALGELVTWTDCEF
jgi:hypothetical protein